MRISTIISKKQNSNDSSITSEQAIPLFSHFVRNNKRNQLFLCIALAGTILQLVIFKHFYPLPDFFSDSYSYIFAAYANLDINIWPIGYSKFLLLFHNITHSATAVVSFQYFFLELSAAYFFFSFLYLYRPRKKPTIFLFAFLFFNPLFLYISNYINSDPLFAALSLCWFTQLLWIVNRPSPYQILAHAFLLFLCFTVRNNAYYYPLISLIAFISCRQHWTFKIAGIALPFFLIIPFIIHTRNAAYKMTGTRQFSLFTGWQLANNALYMRWHLKVDTTKLPNAQTRELDRLARSYFNNRPAEFDDYLSEYVANFFIRQPEAPLKDYYYTHYETKDDMSSVVAWGKASVIFGEWGSYLIKNYPIQFLRYYLMRNTTNYYMPPLEKLEIYNTGDTTIESIAAYWFQFKNRSVKVTSYSAQGKILYLYPLFFMFVNVYFLGMLLWGLLSERMKIKEIIHYPTLLIASSFWLINACFSILATVNVFRYQFIPMIVCIILSILITELLDKRALPKAAFFTNPENKALS